MTHIALITLHTPTVNNHNGASALPYHLIACRPKGINVEIWSFNINSCDTEQIATTEKSLGVRIHIIPKTKLLKIIQPAPVRLMLPKPILGYLRIPDRIETEINDYLHAEDPAVWIYGEDISGLATKFKNTPIVITTPDCEAMYYYRVLGMNGIPLSKLSFTKYALMYHRYARFISQYPTGQNITYHLVGKADAAFLKKLNPEGNVVFLHHPHYDVIPRTITQADPHNPIRLLIAGRYDFYMSTAVDEATDAMITLPDTIKKRYQITFLGKNWESSRDKLANAGFNTEIKLFVKDYATEIGSHHIQLTPVATGTGTKGKVLDAFANGLMVIGTPLALENIAVKSGKECVEYSTGSELAQWLGRIANDPSIIYDIAKAGKESVLQVHGRNKVAKEFFHLFK